MLDVDGSKHCFGSAASAFEIIELAFIRYALKENFSVTLTKRGFTFVSLASHAGVFRGTRFSAPLWGGMKDKLP